MWQSRVEIEGYSVAYFDRIAVLEAPYRWGRGSYVLRRCMNIYEAHMSPALNGSSAIWRFEGSDAIEIRNGITFDFYTGLPHIPSMYTSCVHASTYGSISTHIACLWLPAHTDNVFVRSQKRFGRLISIFFDMYAYTVSLSVCSCIALV